MEQVKQKLIQQAKKEHQCVKPCGTNKHLLDCFTVEDDKLLFWFNTSDSSTKMLQHDLVDTNGY